MRQKQKRNALLIIACVLSYVSVAVSVILAIMLGFDIAGVKEIYKEFLVKYVSPNLDLNSQANMYIIELGVTALMNMYFAGFYLKGIKFRVDTAQFGRMLISQGLFQMLIASFVPGLFALIAGCVMSKRKPIIVADAKQDNAYLSSYKMEAMSEAVRRLKELKEQGAISEEEYYASLNKILEG